MAQKTWVQSQVESYQRLKKWYLMLPGLTLSIIRYLSRVKESNPGKGVASSPTPQCCSYRKGSLRVTLDCGRQLYFNRLIGQVGSVFTNVPEDQGSVPDRIIQKTLKMVLETSQHYKVWIRGKVEQSRKGVVPSSTPCCSSYWNGSLLVPLNYDRQLYFLCNKQFDFLLLVCLFLYQFGSFAEDKWLIAVHPA